MSVKQRFSRPWSSNLTLPLCLSSQIVDGYLRLMRDENCPVPLPEDLCSDKDRLMGKDKIIFGNIEAIYEWHRE